MEISIINYPYHYQSVLIKGNARQPLIFEHIVRIKKLLREKPQHIIEFDSCDLSGKDLSFIKGMRTIRFVNCKIDGVILPPDFTGVLGINDCSFCEQEIVLPESLATISMLDTFFDKMTINIEGMVIYLSGCKANVINMSKAHFSHIHIMRHEKTGKTILPQETGTLALTGCNMANITMPEKVASFNCSYLTNIDPEQSWWQNGREYRLLACEDHCLIQTGELFLAGCVGPLSYDEALAYVSIRSKPHHILFRDTLMTLGDPAVKESA